MARLSEKTLELSICSQFSMAAAKPNPIWFGLTQQEERQFGFDACSSINGRLLICQFKASNSVARGRRVGRIFRLPHDQLLALQSISQMFPGCAYYIFPNIGNTNELLVNQDLLSQSWALDVSKLRSNPFPFPKRISGYHLAYLSPPRVTICSSPVEVEVVPLSEVVDGLERRESNSQEFAEWIRIANRVTFGYNLIAALFPRK